MAELLRTYCSKLVVVLFAGLLSVGCAAVPEDPIDRQIYEQANDPARPLNEAVFEFNLAIDRAILRPIAKGYEAILPQLVRDSVRNFLRNLNAPVILANNIMQGDEQGASDTIGRFLTNTTIGLGGLFDVAGEAGVEYRKEDFGQTLAVWGTDEGAYLMLPILGPSNVRDFAGFIVDAGLDPLRWWGYEQEQWVSKRNTAIRSVAFTIDNRSRNYEQIEDLEETSLDFYATVRSLYRQDREDMIRNGAPASDEDDMGMDDISFDVHRSEKQQAALVEDPR